ncbi:MAG TPA: phosphatase PAP2 family protein [Gemmatimonadales bacterium]|nr:phosphatase PAP2 family protein [Gemmatimonadales bacterium]
MRESSIQPESGGSNETRRLLSATLIVGLVAAVLALLVFSWLGREVVTGVTPAMDEQLRTALHGYASPGLTRFMIEVSRFGGPSWLVPLGIVLALAFLLHGWHRGALLIIITLSGAGLLNTLLKQTFARTRPEAFFDYPLPLSQSFPSGHAIFAASVLGGLAVLLSDRISSKPLQVLVWVTAVALVVLVGVSRVYLGVHYPSDVLAGYAVAVFWVVGVALGDRITTHRFRRSRT